MNRAFMNGAALLIASGVASSVAYGQSDVPVSTGVSVRLGMFFPFNSTTKQAGDAWLAYGAQYRIVTLDSTPTSRTSLAISADYFGREGYSEAPVLLNYLSGANHAYFSLGAGVGFVQEPGVSGTDFAYQVGVGYDFPTTSNASFFVEAHFWGSDRSEMNGAGVYAGVHF